MTAQQAVDQIYLSVEALESKRALRCNTAVLSFLDICEADGQMIARQYDRSAHTPQLCSRVYENASKLLAHAFELEGVIIQELPWSTFDANSMQGRRERLLGSLCKSAEPLLDSTAERLWEAFPSGAVCHLLSEAGGYGTFAVSLPGDKEFGTTITIQLFQHKATPEQFIFLPLLNTFHHRHTAFLLGWATASIRVLSSRTDLLPLSSFGWTIMSEIRRIEEQILDRKKNDFLGSVSHEMRSPLHGLQACILLARDAESRTQQVELLDSASSCALQLGDTIDNILMHSNIGSPAPSGKSYSHLRSPNRQMAVVQTPSSSCEDKTSDPATNLMTFVEEVIAKERSKSKSMTPSIERRADSLPTADLTWQTTVVVDATPSANFVLLPHSDVGVIISNLLVSTPCWVRTNSPDPSIGKASL